MESLTHEDPFFGGNNLESLVPHSPDSDVTPLPEIGADVFDTVLSDAAQSPYIGLSDGKLGGVSDTSNAKGSSYGGKRGSKDPSRNARMAKENRERKKKYVSGLEAQVGALRAENSVLTAQKSELEQQLAAAKSEITALQNALTKSSDIARVLQALGGSKAISFSSSVGMSTDAAAVESDNAPNAPPAKRAKRCGTAVSSSSTYSGASRQASSTVIPIQLNLQIS